MHKENKEQKYVLEYLASQFVQDKQFPSIPPGLDWLQLYQLLDQYRLTSLFFSLGKNKQSGWPKDFNNRLRNDRYRLMLYGDQCRIQIKELLSALGAEGIRVIVLKGWAYIQTIYFGDHSLRYCDDIDLLVHPKDIDATEKLLQQLGYHLERESWPGYTRRYQNGARYFLKDNPKNPASTFSIGLHWGLWHIPAYDPELVDIEQLFRRSLPLQVAGVRVLELSLEDQIVYACAHLGLHHRFDKSMFRYYELAHLILREPASLDWEKVLSLALSWQCLLPLRSVLQELDALWAGVVPEGILAQIRMLKPAKIEFFTMWWIEHFSGRQAFDHLLTWLTFPDWKQRPLILMQDMFPHPQYMQYRYGRAPGGFLPYLYVCRFFRAFQHLFK